MIQLSHRRRLANLEAKIRNPNDECEDWILAWSVAMLFGLGDHEPQGPRESRDTYEARTFGVTTREWKSLCKVAGPDSDFVKVRDDLRKLDRVRGDREQEKAVISEISERLKREIAEAS